MHQKDVSCDCSITNCVKCSPSIWLQRIKNWPDTVDIEEDTEPTSCLSWAGFLQRHLNWHPFIQPWDQALVRDTISKHPGPRDHAPTVGAPLTYALLQQNSDESQGFLSDKSLQKTPRKETSDSKFLHALPFRLWVNWNKMKPLPGNTARMTIFKSILEKLYDKINKNK